jgi:uncharacterized protein (TIGR00252 family)
MSQLLTSTEVGRQAEQAAAAYLQQQGYRIIGQNWRTRWCEIDLVVLQDGQLLFVEVKYRRRANQGQGLDYITPAKLRRMQRAAQLWVERHRWPGDYGLAAVGLSGVDFAIVEFVAEIV